MNAILNLFWGLFAHRERAGKQYQHADGNAGIGKVENLKRTERAKMQIGIINDIAVLNAVGNVAQRAAQRSRAIGD